MNYVEIGSVTVVHYLTQANAHFLPDFSEIRYRRFSHSAVKKLSFLTLVRRKPFFT